MGKLIRFLMVVCWLACVCRAMGQEPSVQLDQAGGLLASVSGPGGRQWLAAPVTIRVRNEVTGQVAEPGSNRAGQGDRNFAINDLASLGLTMTTQWSYDHGVLEGRYEFTGDVRRVGHEIIMDWPILSPEMQVFTPGERGLMSIDMYPDYQPIEYGHFGWSDGRYYVLPLVSVLDPQTKSGMTIALPADDNIPHLRVEWLEGKTLRMHLAHRGMGGGRDSTLRLQLLFHEADYRSVLKAYSDLYPRHFKPGADEIPYQGSFWYHHIHDHPPFEEMARQNVHFIWMSFWFTHLGEYLPHEKEWKPYTYAKWWSLGETMSDNRINAFIDEMHAHGIGAFAYFNVTEYGGMGGESGGAERANQILREQFADALMKNEAGTHIPTWEGAVAMNARQEYSLFPFLREQLEMHLERLPEIDGFAIDRLDWASKYDYGHDDGLTMIGDRPADNMAGAVAEGVAEVCRQAHAAGKNVFVNQFWKVEMLRDVDGYCCEYDNVRGLGYLAPYRPVSAWNHAVPYKGDLLPFEAQLKRRLQFAVFPQMIAHEFPVSQQSPDPEAADLLELFAPLFEPLIDTVQVLQNDCVEATGPNDVNLFINKEGHYVVPVTSRTQFMGRGARDMQMVGSAVPAMVTITTEQAGRCRWAHIHEPGLPTTVVQPMTQNGKCIIPVQVHRGAAMVVVGQGEPPALAQRDLEREGKILDRLFGSVAVQRTERVAPQELPGNIDEYYLLIDGRHLGPEGKVQVEVGGQVVGFMGERLVVPEKWVGQADRGLSVTLITGDEGTWFLPRRVVLIAVTAKDEHWICRQWVDGDGWSPVAGRDEIGLVLSSCRPHRYEQNNLTFLGRSSAQERSAGSLATWLPQVYETPIQHGYQLVIEQSTAYRWAEHTEDARVIEPPAFMATAGRPATCWFDEKRVVMQVIPSGMGPYRLGLYLLDFDRQNRAMEVRLRRSGQVLDTQSVDAQAAARGTVLSWRLSGPVEIEVHNRAGANAVVSGVFVDHP